MAPPAYREIDPSPLNCRWYEDQYGRLQFRAERLLECSWADRPQLIGWLYSESGAPYPHDDGPSASIVRHVEPMARGGISGTATKSSYERSVVRVFYDSFGPRWVNGAYVDEYLVPRQIWVRPPGDERLAWSDGKPLTRAEMAVAVPVDTVSYVQSWGRQTTYPTDALDYIKTTNASPKICLLFSFVFPPGTLLYGPPRLHSHFAYQGGLQYYYTFNHTYNPNGWNKFWRAATNSWEALYTPAAEPYLPYPPGW